VSALRINLAAVLQQTALLAGLSQPELQMLAVRTVRKLFGAGELMRASAKLGHSAPRERRVAAE
jgi:hypothetical protein